MGNGPFIDGLPIKHGDFPWQTVKLPDGNIGFLMFDVQNTQNETLRFDMVARVQSDDWMLTPCPTY